MRKPKVNKEDVVSLYKDLTGLGIKVWLDGGWGVDALLNKQTRSHEDIDIVVQEKNVAKLREYFKGKGYKDVDREDTRAWNFVLGDDEWHLVDVHVIVFDEKGNGIYGPIRNENMYPAKSLTGIGFIGGEEVKCLTAAYQVESRTGYKLTEQDYLDVRALCEEFGLEYPSEYRNLKK